MIREAEHIAPTTDAATLDATGELSPRRLLALGAQLSLVFPLSVLWSLYGEWLLASLALGHPPRPSIDDPKDVPLANIAHWGTMIALVAMLPMGVAALALNTWDASARKLGGGVIAARAVVILGLLAGTIAWLRWDPGRVMYWWMD